MADEPIILPELPEDLNALSDEEIVGMHGELEAAYQALRQTPTPANRDLAKKARSAQAKLAKEATGRAEAANDFAELDAAENVALPEAPAAEEPEVVTPDEVLDPATAEAPPAEGEVIDVDPVQATGELVGAGAQTAGTNVISVNEIVDNREGGSSVPPATQTPRHRMALTAAAGSSIAQQGTEVDWSELGIMVDQAKRMNEPGKAMLASVGGFEQISDLETEPLRKNNGPEKNTELIHEAVDAYMARAWDRPRAMTAAICEPFDIIREIPDCTQAAEPLSDSLPTRPIGRLAFQFIPSMSISDFTVFTDAESPGTPQATDAFAVVWDEAAQAAVDPTDPTTWKPCAFIDCPEVETVAAKAITACLTWDITTDMSSPERIQDAMRKLAARRARLKTEYLLGLAETFSHHFRMTGPYGALPGFIEGLITMLAQGEYAERLDDGTPYQVYTPPGLLEALVIDRNNVANPAGVNSGAVAAYVSSECADAGWNIRVIDLEDVSINESAPFAALPTPSVGSATPLPGLGGSSHPFRVHVIAPESVLYGSTGEINTGVERSPELMRQNRAQMFSEEFLLLTKHGCYPWFTLDLTLCPNGGRAGLVTPYSCTGSLT
jgi:hypothetical protein